MSDVTQTLVLRSRVTTNWMVAMQSVRPHSVNCVANCHLARHLIFCSCQRADRVSGPPLLLEMLSVPHGARHNYAVGLFATGLKHGAHVG